MKIVKKILCLFMVLCLFLIQVKNNAFAKNDRNSLVILGENMLSSEGLPVGSKSYQYILEDLIEDRKGIDIDLADLTSSGKTMSKVFEDVITYENKIKKANIIVLNPGFNDILNSLEESLKKSISEIDIEKMSIDEISKKLSEILANLIKNAPIPDYQPLVNKVNTVNSKAQMIVTTIYNPINEKGSALSVLNDINILFKDPNTDWNDPNSQDKVIKFFKLLNLSDFGAKVVDLLKMSESEWKESQEKFTKYLESLGNKELKEIIKKFWEEYPNGIEKKKIMDFISKAMISFTNSINELNTFIEDTNLGIKRLNGAKFADLNETKITMNNFIYPDSNGHKTIVEDIYKVLGFDLYTPTTGVDTNYLVLLTFSVMLLSTLIILKLKNKKACNN